MGIQDSDEATASFRGDLLEIASLLTNLQSHLAPEGFLWKVPEVPNEDNIIDESGPYVITLQDLQNVLDYRILLREWEDIQNTLAMARDIGRSELYLRLPGEYFAEQLNTELEQNQLHIKKCTPRTRRIDVLWTRLEVWWTKVVAQRLLLSPSREFSDDPSKVGDCCSSPLLNLPGSRHFQKVIAEPIGIRANIMEPEAVVSAFHQHKVPCCSLALPPNKHTWNEFARLSRMVMLLEARSFKEVHLRKQKHPREVALKSPCCLHYGALFKHKHFQHTLSKDFEFSPPHLMALWVRAQRNTQAMRHLWMLFKVFPKDTEGPGNPTPHGHQPASRSVEFAGNPPHARSFVVDCSNLVDKFVEWAVTNQVLFTHRHVQKRLVTAPMLKSKRKPESDTHHPNSHKRVRVDFGTDSELLDLRAAALRFVLRWFVRRNRFVASFLVARDVDQQHLDLVWTESDRNSVKDIFAAVIHNYRKALHELANQDGSKIVGEDWNLARVEARILRERNNGVKIFDLNDPLGSSIYRQLVAMLDALRNSTEWNAAQDIQIQNAKEDLHSLFDRFFGISSNICSRVLSDLIDSSSHPSTPEVTELLLSSPTPFPHSCYACDEKGQDDLWACANCERAFHFKDCSQHQASTSLASLATLNECFGMLCLLNQPQVERIPDYTVGDCLRWATHSIYIERALRQDGSVTPLGLGLRGVKECAEIFKRLASPGATKLDLARSHSKEIRTGKLVLPVSGLEDGSIILGTKDGDFCGKAAGLAAGDVIISVEHLEIPDPAYAGKKKFYDFSKIPKASQRYELLLVPSTKLRLRVRRPSRNIIQESRGWYDSLKNVNPGFQAFAESQMEYRFCDDCWVEDNVSLTDKISQRTPAMVLADAQRCRAVIRRVGQESFSFHFTEENPSRSAQTSQVNDGIFFSLRRLDAIMTSIITRYTRKGDDHDANSISSAAFMLPPWVEALPPTRRIEWASERLEFDPINLLCQALLAWQKVDEKDDARLMAKKKMIRLFVLLIPSWCILPSSPSKSLRTKGPPNVHLNFREPWLTSSCEFCCSRPAEGPVACGHNSCREMLLRDSENIGELERSDASSVLKRIVQYNECSSLVGTTVLFLATDPLVTALKRDVIEFDHDCRSVEYIVASYLPADFVSIALKAKPKNPFFDKFDEGSGIFHLFPVISSNQMKFVLDRCTLRKNPNHSTDCMGVSWVSPGALNIDGVARYSLRELKKKIIESDAVRRSIDAFVASQNDDEHDHFSDLSLGQPRSSQEQIFARVRYDRFFFDEALNLELVPASIPCALTVKIHNTATQEVGVLGDISSWESEFGDVHAEIGCAIADSTVVTLEVLRPEESSCTLIYSDMYYVSPVEVPSLIQAVMPPTLISPPPSSGNLVERTVLLQRSRGASSPGSYKGIGFGFEVVHWGSQRVHRVGRVHRNSPAFGNLQTGDIILSAGGKSLDDIQSLPELVATLLGVPVQIKPPSSGGDQLCMTLAAIKQSQISLDSVVLNILRTQEPAATAPVRSAAVGAIQVSSSTHNGMLAIAPPPALFLPKSRQEQRDAVGARQIDGLSSQANHVYDQSRTILRRTHPREQFRFSSDLSQLRVLVLRTAQVRMPVKLAHLYRAAGFGSFTLLEWAVFLEALLREEPMLGVRMLCPRYSIEVIDQEIVKLAALFEHNVVMIPRVSTYVYEVMLHKDYLRSINQNIPETGEPFFLENNYTYRIPIDILPIDRTAEGALTEEETWKTQDPSFGAQTNPRHGVPVNDSFVPDCIRGGGPLRSVGGIARSSIAQILDQSPTILRWTHPREQFRFSSDLSQLRVLVLRTAQVRMPVKPTYLYRAAGFGSIFTLLECAVFLEALLREEPMLGVRMLCPRYSIEVIDQEIVKLAALPEHHVVMIPRVSTYVYEVMLHKDYLRSINQNIPETGEPFFLENNYTYRIPIDILPIDRTADDALKMEETQQTQDLSFGAETNPQHGVPINDSFVPDRIRGGGPLLSVDGVARSSIAPHESMGLCMEMHDGPKGQDANGCITGLAVKNWNDKPVYSVVDDEEGREILVVGFIHGPTLPSDQNIPVTVDVKVHYAQKIGYIAPPRIYQLYPEDTFLVESSAPDEAVAVLEKLRATHTDPSMVRPTDEEPEVDPRHVMETIMQDVTSMGLKVMGITPDGREIVWISGDPTALYVADAYYHNLAPNAGDNVHSHLSQSNDNRNTLNKQCLSDTIHNCPWGCSTTADRFETRGALSFDSLPDLHHHCSSYHNYGETSSAICIGREKQFFRIAEGEEVLSLCADVSAAIVAHSSLLLSEQAVLDPAEQLPIIQLPSGVEFVKSPTGTKVLLAWSDTRLRNELVANALSSTNPGLLDAVNLWSAIGSVFDCEVSGRFRLSPREFEIMVCGPKTTRPNSEHSLADIDCCQFVSMDASCSQRRFQSCSLCSLPWESCIGSGSLDGIENTGRGLGCVLRSDISFDKVSEGDTGGRPASKTGEAKELLLRVAALIQKGLRVTGKKVGEGDPVHGHRVWDECNYKTWETFVSNCTTPGMFSQALVVLMGSIDRTKMPSWWKQDGVGWSTFQMLMANAANMDLFFLHLYVLDAALSETIGRSLMGDKSSKKTNKRKGSTQQQMARWVTYARELVPPFTPHTGSHDCDCMYCDDGGDLLCCEYCSNVAHAECCEPVIEQAEITVDLTWICDSCINDICQRKGVTRQNLDKNVGQHEG